MTSAKRAKQYDKCAIREGRSSSSQEPPDGARQPFWDEAMVFSPHSGPVAIQRQFQPRTTLHEHSFTELVIVTDGTSTKLGGAIWFSTCSS